MIHWRRNIVAKIIALIAAIFLWFFVMNEQNPIMELNVTVPVETVGLNPNYIVQETPSSVRVTLRGARNTIIRLDHVGLKATLDLSGVTVGKQIVPIKFTPPNGMTMASMDPINATIDVDAYEVKELPLEMRSGGKLPEIMGIKNVSIVPTTVTVSGAKTRVDAVTHAYVRVKLDDRSANFTSRGAVELTDAVGNEITDVTVTPNQGDVAISLERVRFDKSVNINVPTVGTPSAGFRVKAIDLQPKQVTISGKQNEVQALNSVDTESVSLDGVVGNISRELKIPPVNGVTVAPSSVRVIIEIEPSNGGNSGGRVTNATNN